MIVHATVETLEAYRDQIVGLTASFLSASAQLRDVGIAIDQFFHVWQALIQSGIGVVLLAVDDGKVAGALGGLIAKEDYCNDRFAQEGFWFVGPDHRRSGVGGQLFDAFEQWAKDKGAARVRMIHLSDSMPEAVARIYEDRGYRKVQTVYGKEV